MNRSASSPTPRASLDRSLQMLEDDMLRMGDMIDTAIVRSLKCLQELDESLAEEVIAGDDKVNDLRFQIEETCLELIATQQPAARDLRAIVAAMNMVSDLERMGDHAAGIAKTVLRMGEDRMGSFPKGLTQMADFARKMLRQALEAYTRRDDELAYKVATQDTYIDEQYKALFRELVEIMAREPGITSAGLYLMFTGHNLERIADRVTNLAERIIFMTSGKMEELNPEPDEAATN